jgi:hypothetical protein
LKSPGAGLATNAVAHKAESGIERPAGLSAADRP